MSLVKKKKWYDVVCAGCGDSDSYPLTQLRAQREALKTGWIVGAGGKYYCGYRCAPLPEKRRK